MMVGYNWFYKLLERDPDISVRKADGISLFKAQSLTTEEADAYLIY